MRTAKKVIAAGAMAGALLSIGGIAYADSSSAPPAVPGAGPSVPAIPSHSFGGCIVVGSDGTVKIIEGKACVGDPNHVAHVVPVPARPQG